jgi:hypothetical protein
LVAVFGLRGMRHGKRQHKCNETKHFGLPLYRFMEI